MSVDDSNKNKCSSSGAFNMSTDEGSSMAMSNGPYEVIEYDPGDKDMMNMAGLESLNIEDNTPAAEAIRANANVRVSPFGKAARAVHMQSLRRFVKRATLSGKSGVVRGKPPRIPEEEEAGDDASSDDDGMPSLISGSGSAGQCGGGPLDPVPETEASTPPTTPTAETEEEASATARTPALVSAPSTPPRRHEAEDVSENGHLPDTVVPGTLEASKKGKAFVSP